MNNNVDMNALVLEVLSGDSAFSKEMQGKISSALDLATEKMKSGIKSTQFKTGTITISDLTNIDKEEQKRSANAYKAKQKVIIDWVKDVALAAKWANLRDGVTINDLFNTKPDEQKRFADSYKELQKKILKAVKDNIPTKIDVIPGIAENTIKQKSPKKISDKPPQKESVAEATDESKIPDSIPNLDDNLSQTNTLIQTIVDKTQILIDIVSSGISSLNKFEGSANSLINNILQKMDILIEKPSGNVDGKEGDVAGRESFQETGILIGQFSETAIKQLIDIMPSMKPAVESLAPQNDKKSGGFLKSALKFAGITALMGFITFLAKNPEKWEKLKEIFKEKIIPLFKKIPYYLEIAGGFIWYFIEDSIKLFKKSQKWMEDKFWPAIFSAWNIVVDTFKNMQTWMEENFWTPIFNAWEWIVDGFNSLGSSVMSGLDHIGTFVNDWIIQPFITFAKHLGEGFYMLPESYDKYIITPVSRFFVFVWEGVQAMGQSLKDNLLSIPAFLKEKLDSIKTAFIESLPGFMRPKTDDEKIAKIQQQIEEEQKKIDDSKRGDNSYRFRSEESGRSKSQEKINKLTEELRQLNPGIEVLPGKMEDGIVSNGKFKEYSKGDIAASIDIDALLDSGKRSDENMMKLTNIMESIKKQFDDLLYLNNEMLKKPTGGSQQLKALPAIENNISAFRGLAHDEAMSHKTRVWEILHGYA